MSDEGGPGGGGHREGALACVLVRPARSRKRLICLPKHRSGLYGHAFASAGDGDLRRWLVARLEMTADPHAKRYWQLLATVNGWPASPTLAPVYTWFTTAPCGASVAAATS